MLDQLLGYIDYFVPEIIAILLMTALLIAEASVENENLPRTKIHVFSQIILAVIAVILMTNIGDAPRSIFYNAVTIDSFSTVVKLIMTLGTMGAIFLSHTSLDIYPNMKSEFSIMAVGVLIGGMLLASANNMITLYLGIETLSILSYVLSSLKREESSSTEAGLKYALYGGLTAGISLFGMSHLYGLFSTVQFSEIASLMGTLQGGQLGFALVAFILFFVGIGYKISAFPFHMWTPDVYQGSPIPVTSFFAIVPKMAGIAALARVSYVFVGEQSVISSVWIGLILVISALTMSVGNITAISQSSVKRLLAFSSIGHVGMMILGIVVMNESGLQAILFYGLTYLFMTLIVFYITSQLSDMYGTDSSDVFKGLIYKHPLMAIVMAGSLFSLAGLPPFSGFIAKFNIFNAIIEKKFYGMAIVAAVNSVIGLYYYMKLTKTMIFAEPISDEKVVGFTIKNQVVIFLLFIPVILLGIFWDGAISVAGQSTLFIK